MAQSFPSKAITIVVRNPPGGVVDAAGLPGFELDAWVGLFAPAGSPPAIVNQLSEQVKKALELPESKTRAATLGIEIRYLGTEALAVLVAKDTEYWGRVIKLKNIQAD